MYIFIYTTTNCINTYLVIGYGTLYSLPIEIKRPMSASCCGTMVTSDYKFNLS